MSRAIGLLLAAVALVVAAGALASLALFALAVGLAAITLAAGATVLLAARRLTVTRSITQHETQEDQAIGVRFQVQGLGRLPLPVRLEAQADVGGWVPLDPRGGTLELLVGRRGAFELGPSRLRLRDTLGIFQRWVLAGQPEALLLLPTPDPRLPVSASSLAWPGDGDPDPDGLQPYVPGIPIGRIHWPALARGAGLQQRRLAPPLTGLPLVVVDTTNTSDPHAVDWAARVAAGVIVRLARSGGCRVLLPGDQVATTVTDLGASWRGVHRRLALLGPAGPPARRAPLGAAQAPDVYIRAAHAPVQALLEQPWPLPPGVLAAADKQAGP
jgi:uncharacterized protein (DUF58 family)